MLTIKTAFVTAYLLLSTSIALGQDKPLAVFSYADTSCGAWTRSATREAARAQYASWFRGFVSGHNFGNPESQVPMGQMPDDATLYLYIDKYCRDNPLNPFTSAAFRLVEELRPPQPVNPPRKAKR